MDKQELIGRLNYLLDSTRFRHVKWTEDQHGVYYNKTNKVRIVESTVEFEGKCYYECEELRIRLFKEVKKSAIINNRTYKELRDEFNGLKFWNYWRILKTKRKYIIMTIAQMLYLFFMLILAVIAIRLASKEWTASIIGFMMINIREEIKKVFVKKFLNSFNCDAIKEEDIQKTIDNIERIVYCAKPTVTLKNTMQITYKNITVEIRKGTKVKLNEIKKTTVSLTYMAQGNITTFDTDIRDVAFKYHN